MNMKAMKFNPQRGERVLVWQNQEDRAVERIFLSEIEGATYPIQAVFQFDEKRFLNGKPFDTTKFKHMKPLNDKLSELERKYKELGEEIEKMKKYL